MKASVILPAYNEEGRIGEVIRRVEEALRGAGLDYEIIVVDDGSTDATAAEVLKYARNSSRVRFVGHSRNLGKGAAVRTGFVHSTGDLVAFIDSDLEVSPELLPMYFKALKVADIAIGSKWHPKSRVEVSWIRKLLSRGFYALVKLLVGVKVSDTQVGLKAFRREALKKILRAQLVKRYAFDVELLVIASLLNLKVVEMPVKVRLKERFRASEILRMLTDLLGITYRLRVLRWYQKAVTLGHSSPEG